jgi:hypothetical protein
MDRLDENSAKDGVLSPYVNTILKKFLGGQPFDLVTMQQSILVMNIHKNALRILR